MKSIYDYLCYCKDTIGVRGVLVITDKQSVFYVQDEYDNKHHDGLYTDIENIIHPTDIREGFAAVRDNNIYIASLGHQFVIYLPENRNLSKNQYIFLSNILDEVNRFNVDNNRITPLYSSYPRLFEEQYETDNIDEMKNKLFNLITKEISIDEEVIIGDVLDSDTIIISMMYHIDLENALCLLDIKESLKMCNKYYNDSYYKNYLLNIFPDFLEVYSLINRFNYDDLLEEVSNVNYNNIKDILLSKLNDYSKQK